MDGIIVVNKPSGITSHDVVDVVRKKLSTRRVGHAGTLDPLATGVLIVLVGKATKLFNTFVAFDKAYRATFILGRKTDSADIQGKVLTEMSADHVSRAQIEEVFSRFMGDIAQVPPMVSAVKVKGKKLYQLARKGVAVERQPRAIRIDRLEIEDMSLPYVRFYVECSKGTYIRQLADDVGDVLGCGACISQIERTKVGPFTLEQSVRLDDINEGCIRDWKGRAAV